MIKLVCILLLNYSASLVVIEPSINEVRYLYQRAAIEEQSCKELMNLLEPFNENTNPLLAGYKANATMMMAAYVSNPFTKLGYFKKGKRMLEKAISADTKNVELRFLRFAAQSNAPSFLGYNDNMEMDKTFLEQNLAYIKDAKLKELITAFLKNSRKS